MDDIERMIGRKRCCAKDFGGSHYHCAFCGGVSSMYGHYVRFAGPDRRLLNFAGPFPFEGFTCAVGVVLRRSWGAA